MSVTDSFFQHWYFHVPNLVLAALLDTMIGRYALELLVARKPDAVMLTVFRSVTDPFLKIVRVVMPVVVPNGLVSVASIVWLIALRMFLYLTVLAAGVRNFA